MRDMDYNKIGLKVGLEIHQQLGTLNKLFCNCPNQLEVAVWYMGTVITGLVVRSK